MKSPPGTSIGPLSTWPVSVLRRRRGRRLLRRPVEAEDQPARVGQHRHAADGGDVPRGHEGPGARLHRLRDRRVDVRGADVRQPVGGRAGLARFVGQLHHTRHHGPAPLPDRVRDRQTRVGLRAPADDLSVEVLRGLRLRRQQLVPQEAATVVTHPTLPREGARIPQPSFARRAFSGARARRSIRCTRAPTSTYVGAGGSRDGVNNQLAPRPDRARSRARSCSPRRSHGDGSWRW